MILHEQNGKQVYSDGSVVEARMLDLAKLYPGDSVRDAIAQNCDYTTNNTFSAVRENILNWYPFDKKASVLEIGAGMGSLTALLCSRCGHVTAVEMSEKRAEVIRARCRGETNLEIVVGDIRQIVFEERFDYVVFVGVLEYAAVFSDSRDPFCDFLSTARSFLKSTGKLLFAIENQYGLKYWLGASEDHLQQPFKGIAGYKKPGTPRTFSKAELHDLLERSGLPNQRFYYVYPDYKFPTMLFTDEWIPDGPAFQNIAFTYGKNSVLTANEKDLYADLAQNQVLPFFANSFFVEASMAPLEETHPIFIAGRGEVKPEYRIATIIDTENSLRKIAVHPAAQTHIDRIEQNEAYLARRGIRVLQSWKQENGLIRPLYEAPRADEVFTDLLQQNDLKAVLELVDSLKADLLKSSEQVSGGEDYLFKNGLVKERGRFGTVLKRGFIDMTFYNAFFDSDGLIFFDQEWCFPDIPLAFILYYAVKSVFKRCRIESTIQPEMIYDYLRIGREMREAFDRTEEFIWSNVLYRQGDLYGEGGYCTQYYNAGKFDELLKRGSEFAQLSQELLNRKGHIELLLQSERDLQGALSNKEGECQQLRDKENSLTAALGQKEEECRQLQNKENNLKAVLGQKEEECRLLQDSEDHLKEALTQREKAYQKLEDALACREGECQQLRDKENRFLNELAVLKASRSWRLGQFFAKIMRFFVPTGSKRAVFARLLVTMVKHPGKFFSCLRPKKIKKFYRLLRSGEVVRIHGLIQMNVTGQPPLPELEIAAPEVVPVSTEACQEKTAADYPVLSVPQWEDPMVSIVIPVYNQFDYTYHCVGSIVKNSGVITYEILIGNDCSTDLTVEIDRILPGVRCITNEKNLRFLRNCNHAAKYAKGKYLLFLNNDTQVQENWLEPLVTLIESAGDIGMVGSKLVYPDGTLQEAGGIVWKDGSAWNYGNRQNPALPEFNYVKEVDYISGASIMIHRWLWEEIGGFDEQLAPAYYEDTDLAFTVRKMGYRVMYQPLSVVVHFEGASNGTDTSSGQKAYQVENQRKFVEKWRAVLEAEHFENGVKVFSARERSARKETVLVIDHYIPTYDKDAGSRSMDNYLKLLVDMGLNVKFLGDNFNHDPHYARRYEQMGIEMLTGVYYRDNWKKWVEDNADRLDYVLLSRPHISIKYIDFLREKTKAKIVYYVQDLHFLREEREYELTHDSKLLESSKQLKKQEMYIMEHSDTVFTLSQVEKNIIDHDVAKDRAVITPISCFSAFADGPVSVAGKRDIIFVGGFGHHPNEDGVLWFMDEIWGKICAKVQDCRLVIIGSNPTDKVKALQSDNVVVAGFVSDEELEQHYDQARICVIPLRYGAGVKGKTVEAMYHRVPIVSTSVGIEGLAGIEEYVAPADDADAFAQSVIRFWKDTAYAEQVAEGYYTYLKEHMSYESALNLFKSVFKKD